MEKFKPRETEFIGLIKKQIEKFITNSAVIDDKLKRDFIKELGFNWHDDRFDATEFIDDAVGYSICIWKEQNLQLAELWKEIAINNAKVNNEPHKVADETVARFKDEFNCDT